jgi:hypothetical protein
MTQGRDPEQLANWIRENRAAYTREALDRAIAEQGWSQEEIAAAWQIVDAGPVSPWAAAARRAGPSDRRAELILLLVLLVPLTALAVLFETSLGPLAAGGPWKPVLIAGVAVTVAIPVITVILVTRRRAPLGCAGLLAVGIVVGAAIFGTCLLTLNAGAMP